MLFYLESQKKNLCRRSYNYEEESNILAEVLNLPSVFKRSDSKVPLNLNELSRNIFGANPSISASKVLSSMLVLMKNNVKLRFIFKKHFVFFLITRRF